MGDFGLDDAEAFFEPEDFDRLETHGDTAQQELDMWSDMMGPGTSFPEGPDDEHLTDEPSTSVDGFPTTPGGAPTTSAPGTSPTRRSLQRQLSQESTRSTERRPHAVDDPYTNTPVRDRFASSSSDIILPAVSRHLEDTPGPKAGRVELSELTPPQKRRRLIGKCSPGVPATPDDVDRKLTKNELMELLKEHTGFLRLRELYQRERRVTLRAERPDEKSPAILNMARVEWSQRDETWRLQWAQEALNKLYKCCPKLPIDRTNRQRQEQAEREEQLEIEQSEGSEGHANRFRGCLGTWNGDWFSKNAEWTALVARELPEEDFLQAARETQCLRDLAADFEKVLKLRCQKLGLQKWSFQIEASLKSSDVGRIHIHAFVHTLDKRVHCGTRNAWAFRGALPHMKHCSGRGMRVDRLLDRGHYYCQCDKSGHLCRGANYFKYLDFGVEQRWVIALWQLRKLSHTAARKEIIMARGHTNTYLKEIDKVEQLEEEIALQQQKAEIDDMLSRSMLPFKIILDVELWKMQYSKDPTVGSWGSEPRFKFLVMTGPSCYGKTQFAKAVWGLDQTLLVQCQNVTAPCLTNFKRLQHKAVVFDECSTPTIVKNKALFQANSDGVLLGQSQCNEHAYWKFLYGVPLMICCNDWLTGIEPGSEDEKWLLANSIVYDVKFHLWVQDASEERLQDIEV